MKRGSKVFVCHDGKWSRRRVGTVIETRRGHHIKIRFEFPYAYGDGPDDVEIIEGWVKRVPAIRYQREKKTGKPSHSFGSTVHLARPAHFAGWIEGAEWFIPWFRVYKYRPGQELPR